MLQKLSDYSHYKRKLKIHHKKAVRNLKKTYPRALIKLKNSSLGALGGALMISSGIGTSLSKSNVSSTQIVLSQKINNRTDSLDLVQNLLTDVGASISDQRLEQTATLLSKIYGLEFSSSIEGNRLNTNWGYFGQEQHLYRWKGDTLASHINRLEKGLAPGKGAFGYFDNAEQERYYIATQLHLIRGWDQNWSTLKPFFRYRRVLVYNPNNNKAVIAVIGDAGPAQWTGKQFGGSPELMEYLNMYDGSKRSRALVLFLKDSDYNKVSLGPLNLNSFPNLVSSIL